MTDSPVSTVPYPALRIDADGRVAEANALALVLFDVDPVGRALSELVAPEDGVPEDLEGLLAAVRAGTHLHVHGPDGVRRYRASAEPWGDGALLVLNRPMAPGTGAFDLDLLAAAVDAAHHSIVISDLREPDQPLCYVNRGFTELTGYEREEALGRNCRFLQLRPDGVRDDQGEQAAALDRIREAVSTPTALGGVVVRNYTKDGRAFYNELSLTPISDEAGRPSFMIGVQNDVTRRVEAQAETDRQRAHVREVFAASAAPLGLLERGADGALVHVFGNAAAAEVFGVDADDGVPIDGLGFADAGAAGWTAAACDATRTGRPARFDVAHADGRIFEVILSPVAADGTPRQFLYVAADVTDGRSAAEDLLQVSNRQLQRIAQDVHDGVGQSLVGASMMAAALARDLAGTPHAAEASRVQGLLARSLSQLRSFALGLDPVDLDRLSAGEALARLAAEARAALGVDVAVEDRLEGAPLGDALKLDLYRVAQEALTNAVRHGGARAVRVTLGRAGNGAVELLVADDGLGMCDPAAGSGMGLRTMRARARRHGGSFAVETGDAGTTVRLQMPASPASEPG